MLEAGTELGGRYRIVRRIGAGGVGTVYEAQHTGIGRRVAVKILDGRHADNAAVVARFQREARAASAVGHENIVQVMDSGTHEGLPYIVMEYLRGESLAARRAALGTLPMETSCQLVGQVLSALAAAHGAGIVHCDLKPDNVFLVKRGDSDTVKLLDFGISKFNQGGSSEFNTRQGEVLGTPAFMAPEQWMDRRKLDARADLFSAGVVLYQLLTGKLPFQAETDGHLLLEIVGGNAEPPAPGSLVPGIAPALDAVVLKALRRDREERYASAREFLDALRPFGAADVVVSDAQSILPPADASDESTPPGRDMDVDRDVITQVDGSAVGARGRARMRRSFAAAGALAIVVAGSLVAMYRSSPHADSTAQPSTVRAAVSAPLDAAPVRAHARLELRGVPEGGEVLLDGQRQASTVLELESSTQTRHVEIHAGAMTRSLDVVADHDQVILVDMDSAATVAPRANTGTGSPVRGRSGDAPSRPGRGGHALRLNRQF